MKNERNRKSGLAVTSVFAALFAMSALVSVSIGIAFATTIYVPDDCAKIQWTVDNASAGDTINVMGGTNENEGKAYSHLYEIMDKYKHFYVYFDKNASINHYSPSYWMGDSDDITFGDNWTSNPHSGKSCVKITYSASGSNSQNWAGIYWLYPEGNFGNYPGYNLTGATNFSFWARGENGNEKGEFKIGGINCPPYHDPNLPYQDSFGPLTTGVVTLTNTWKKYTVNLTGRNLGNVIGGFCWVTNKPSNPNGCTFYLDDIMYENRNQLRFLESYESTPTFDSDYTAWTYDNALALLAFIARGNATDKERAQILADSFLYVQNNDQTFNDGRVRDGYWATDIKDPSGKNSSIKSPGSGTGNMAWTIIALLRYYEVSKYETYLNASKRLGNWIHDNCNDIRGAGGYTGGYEDKNFDWELEKITWKSTEHNIDAYVAFMRLYNVTGNITWLDRAIHANKFVKAMWNESEGHFWTGTKEDGVTLNEDILPADVNTWGWMVLDHPNKYGEGITWVEDNCLVNPCPRGCGFKGFDFNDDKDGVWFEGTAHMCIAYQIMNESIKSDDFITEIRKAQTHANNSNGKGIVAACCDNVTTGFGWGYPNALHIGATSWYIFAERKLNPFWGINTSDPIPCPPPIIWYVDDDGGAGIDFTRIQDAVDAASDGDIIIVNSGTYYENVNVNYQLKILGNDTGMGKPVVDAGGSGSAITLSADGIMLDGFMATNSISGLGDAGINVTSNNNIITDNTVSNNDNGIHFWKSSSNNKIYFNNFMNNTDNAYTEGSTNIWNSTEKIIYAYNGITYINYLGNYWGDYKEKYPDAEVIDGCGIWDTSYSIDSDADNYPLMEHWEKYFAQSQYPSIMGTHRRTIKPSRTINVSRMYTYPCAGTGGHSESGRIYGNGIDVNGTWNGFTEDWHNISFNTPFMLEEGKTYNYTIQTGSYPLIHHTNALLTTNGWINCTEFIDANGRVYYDWIPAIRLWTGQKVSGK